VSTRCSALKDLRKDVDIEKTWESLGYELCELNNDLRNYSYKLKYSPYKIQAQ
jgi:hypothetical protein